MEYEMSLYMPTITLIQDTCMYPIASSCATRLGKYSIWDFDVCDDDTYQKMLNMGETSDLIRLATKNQVNIKLLQRREWAGKESESMFNQNNQIATYLMVNIPSGFAARKWQSEIGPVFVMRTDECSSITQEEVICLHQFASLMLDKWPDGMPKLRKEWILYIREYRRQHPDESIFAGIDI